MLHRTSGFGLLMLAVLVLFAAAPASAQFTASPSPVTFPNGGSFADQFVTLTSQPQVTATLSITYNSPPTGTWLTATLPFGNSTPTAMQVHVDATGLTPGATYTATITVNGGGLSPLGIPVTLTAPQVGFYSTPTSLTFNYQSTSGTTLPAAQNATIINTAGAVAFTVTSVAGTPAGSNPTTWFTFAPTTGNTGVSGVITVTPAAALTAFTTGVYTAKLQVASTGLTTIEINLTLNVNQPIVTPTPSSLNFSYTIGATTPASQTVTITSNTAINSVFPSVSGTVSWLTAGTTTTLPATSLTITVGLQNLGSLTAATYTGNVILFLSTGSQFNIPITLVVSGTGGSVTNAVSPGALAFVATIGGAAPATQTLTLTGTNGQAFTAVASSTGNWLTLNAASGTVTPTANLTVTATITGLTAGFYSGTIQISIGGGATINIPVGLALNPAGAVSVTPVTLTFNYTANSSSLPPNQQVLITSTVANTMFIIPSTGWLGAVSPPTTIAANTATAVNIGLQQSGLTGLTPGSYMGNFRVFVQGQLDVYAPVILNITSATGGGTTSTITVAPNQLFFTATVGGSSPPAQLLLVNTPAGAAATFTATVTPGTGGNWTAVVPTTGNAPGIIAVNANSSGLAAGTYTSTISVLASGATTAITLPVTLIVTAAPALRLSMNNAVFNYQAGGSQSTIQTLGIDASSTGAAFSYTVGVQATSGGTWLSASGQAGTTPSTITITANANGLAAGTYTGTVTFTATGQIGIAVPVTLNVSSAPFLLSSPSILSFSGQTGGAAPSGQTLTITSTGAQAPVTATALTMNGTSTWLTVNVATASTPTQFTVTVTQLGLTDGTYYGAIRINSVPTGSFSNGPIIIPVVFVVGPVGTLAAAPGPLSFLQFVGSAAPGPQTLNITSTGGTLSYSLSVSLLTGTNWLTVSPTTGSTPGQTQVSVNAASLTPGTYTGSVIVTAQGATNSPLVIPVTLIVAVPPTITAAPTTLTFSSITNSATTAGTAPSNQTIVVTSSGINIPITAAVNLPTGQSWLTVTPASTTTQATLTVAVSLTNLAPGTYNGSITINTGLTPITIPVTLNYQLILPPVINQIQNAASGLPTALVPGMILALYGSNLGPATIATYRLSADGRMDTTLANVRVFFDNIPAPVYFARADIVSCFTPYGIAGRTSVNIVVENQGVRSSSINVRVLDASPGIFTANSQGFGQAAMNNADYSINGAANPVARGSYATAYITGEGQTNPGGIDGLFSPLTPLRIPFSPVSVRVGGRQAVLIYAGSVPTTPNGFAQVTFFIPDDAPTGPNVPVDITVGGVPTQGGVTMAIR
ncbi:MAG: hypothetical protein HYZ37_06245 [Candidatus Solibacter usitatus]|nr:hypothetical protein [Candidatus Solibacter usitatus]